MPKAVRNKLSKMVGGALTCPPGFYCTDMSTFLLILLMILSVFAVGVFVAKQYNLFGLGAVTAPQKPQVIVIESKNRPAPPTMIVNPDPRFAPLAPEQMYSPPADIRGFPSAPLPAGLGPVVPINMATRGYPDSYQQVGVLTTPGGTSTSGSPTRTILPLFGRKLSTNRDRWNYYTRTDGFNPVQVPVQFKRRNCDDDNGCDEIMEGDSVGVPVLGNSFTANVYRYSTPRYLPVV